jgi:hypothetical protein
LGSMWRRMGGMMTGITTMGTMIMTGTIITER